MAESLDCNNPLFRLNPVGMNFDFAEKPLISGVNSVCPDFTFKDSCCSFDTIYAMRRNFGAIHYNVAKAIAQNNDRLDASAQELQASIPQFQLHAPEVVPNVHELISSLEEAKALQTECMDGNLIYLAGMFCLGCDPLYSRFVSTTVNGTVVITLHPETCDHVWSHCENLLQKNMKITALETLLRSRLNDITLQRHTPSENRTVDQIIDDLGQQRCGLEGCKDYFCSTALNGMYVSIASFTPSADGSADHGPSRRLVSAMLAPIQDESAMTRFLVDTALSQTVFNVSGYAAFGKGDNSSLSFSLAMKQKPSTVSFGVAALAVIGSIAAVSLTALGIAWMIRRYTRPYQPLPVLSAMERPLAFAEALKPLNVSEIEIPTVQTYDR
eukprot:GILK01009926.1.p1 GENE.GILK01009926.1~~GILK01009926.1.p1  ORF type:complete len:415 (+),score=73.53 GILK01009926.1:96-1247(+)